MAFGGAMGHPSYSPGGLNPQHQYSQPIGPTVNPVAQNAQAFDDYYIGLNSPTLNGYDYQHAILQGRLGAVQNASGASNAASQAQAAIRGQQLDNQIAMNQIDINAIPRQVTNINDILGVQGQQRDSTTQMIDQLLGNTQADYQNTVAQALLQFQQGRRTIGNTAASQGSVTAPETGAALKDTQTAYNQAETAANISRSNATAQLTNQRNQALYDYSLNSLSAKEQIAKLKDRGDQLELQAKNYGLDKDALLAGINATLAQNNLQGILSAGQVLDQMTSNDIQKRQLMNEIVYGGVQYAAGQGGTAGRQQPSQQYSGLPPLK